MQSIRTATNSKYLKVNNITTTNTTLATSLLFYIYNNKLTQNGDEYTSTFFNGR